jgi:hypothetical protein
MPSGPHEQPVYAGENDKNHGENNMVLWAGLVETRLVDSPEAPYLK